MAWCHIPCTSACHDCQACRECAGIEVADAVGMDLLEGQGNATVDWQNDVEGLKAVYEAQVTTQGTTTMLFKTGRPQVD